MTSSPQSQDELSAILDDLKEELLTIEEYQGNQYLHAQNEALEKAEQAILAWRRTTSLLALPEKRSNKSSGNELWIEIGFNQAIDLTKKNIEEL